MRQAVIVSPSRFEVVEAPTPTLRGPDEVLVQTEACGICSGDLMPWYLEKKVGKVLGHEVVGRAIEVGGQVAHVRVGDLVFFHHHAPCQACIECERGAYVHCPTWRSSAIDPGGMAEYIRLPAEIVRNDTFMVPDLDAEEALFIEPLACCAKAYGRLPCATGKTIVVVGCGVMGLLNLQVGRLLGAARLVAVEPDAERRQQALQHGADAAWPPQEAREVLKRSADFVIIGPGHPEVIRQALEYVRPAGVALLFTPTPTSVLTPLDLGDLYFRDVALVPSYSCGPLDTRQAYAWLRERKVRPRSLITHRFPLERVQQAFDAARAGGPALKVVVNFDREAN
jgi:L-iditol 2-dehydrogenase